MKISCYKILGKIEEITNKFSSYGDLDNADINEIIGIWNEVEIIALDKEINFDGIEQEKQTTLQF